MGRRDSDGKKQTWMIEAGDWEKLYAAFIRAKEKNNLLDLRLERKLSGIEKEKVHRDGVLFNDIYEQKQLVFKYKCEVKGMRREAARKERERGNYSNTTSGGGGVGRRRGYLSSDDSALGVRRSHFRSGRMTSRSDTFVTDTGKKVSLPSVNVDASNGKQASQSNRDSTDGGSAEAKQSGNQVDQEESNSPKLPTLNRPVTRSITMPDLTNIPEEQDPAKAKKLDVITAEYWIGDPIAIRSVRRPRLNPNEMSDHCQPYGQARKLMVNMTKYPLCSRNCNKPGADLETLASDTTFLPKIRVPNLTKELSRLSESCEHLPDILEGSAVSQTVLELLEGHGKSDGAMENVSESANTSFPEVAGNAEKPPEALETIAKPANDTSRQDTVDAVRERPVNASSQDITRSYDEMKRFKKNLPNPPEVETSASRTSAANSRSRSHGSTAKLQRKLDASPSKSIVLRSRSDSHASSVSGPATVQEIIEANKNVPVNAPVDVLARVQQGDIGVKSLTDTTRKVTQIIDEAQRRSITSRRDTVVVDKKSKYKSHKVKEVIRYSPTKATQSMHQTEVVN